jgi:hypothetical protein
MDSVGQKGLRGGIYWLRGLFYGGLDNKTGLPLYSRISICSEILNPDLLFVGNKSCGVK